MEKKILLAVDDSIHSRHAIQYAVRMSSVAIDLTFTLFHVQPTISQFLLEEAKTGFKARAELKKVIRKNAQNAQGILEKYKAEMVRTGIVDKRIDVATQPKVLGLVKDILDRAERGLYDAIVVGRRGLSRVQKAFMGSVTAKLVEHSRVIPVWVVDANVTSTRIMVAVDGSVSSLGAVDHLCLMVGENPKIKVTLFHVMPRFRDYCVIDFDDKDAGIDQVIAQGDKRYIDHFYAHARERFREAGIRENQIEIKVTKCTANVGKAIVDEAKKGNYGTVVIGRRGASKAFFMGSVSRYVLDRTSNRALWLVS
ncbi:MAG: universal stress protein [Desulfobacterales bacterium]|nr:MAG: universal stress protein [Desulfobacterales bacterium]